MARRSFKILHAIAGLLAIAALVPACGTVARGPKPQAGRPANEAPLRSDAATSHHSFAEVEKWTRVFDNPQRDKWQKPQELVDALHLRPGMRVADLGAGTGYFSRYLSVAVGDTGTVFAVDTEPNLVVHLRERSEKEKTSNVVPVLASPDNPRLPANATDVILVVDTFHHIDARRRYFRRLRRCLKPGGRVVIVDWQKRELPIGPPPPHKLARERVLAEMTAAGYRLVAEPSLLPYQYVLIFQPQ